MIQEKTFLTPIEPNLPPPDHTYIKVQCFVCKHFPVCNIRIDYLKTAQLMQNILGNPCDSYELLPTPIPYPQFKGKLITNFKEYFPMEVKSAKEKNGTFYAAKYTDSNHIQFMYIYCGYYVFYTATYNKDLYEFEISDGEEICYNLKWQLSEDDIELIKLGLASFKEDIENTPEEEKDVINTTFFSAELRCKFYEWERGLTYADGVKRILAQYPDGIPLDENNTYYHLATFHCENAKVPCYHPENGHPVFAPMPYPVYIPSPCKKQKPPTRDELNDF